MSSRVVDVVDQPKFSPYHLLESQPVGLKEGIRNQQKIVRQVLHARCFSVKTSANIEWKERERKNKRKTNKEEKKFMH